MKYMNRSLLMFIIILLGPLFYILFATEQVPYNYLLLAFGLGFVAVAVAIGVLLHIQSNDDYIQTLFPQYRWSPVYGVGLRQIEFGDFADNLAALGLLLHCLARGEILESYRELRRLREHISQRGDPKSVAWLLPAIDAAMGRA